MYTNSLSPVELNGRYNQILIGLIVNAYTVYYRYPPLSFTIQTFIVVSIDMRYQVSGTRDCRTRNSMTSTRTPLSDIHFIDRQLVGQLRPHSDKLVYPLYLGGSIPFNYLFLITPLLPPVSSFPICYAAVSHSITSYLTAPLLVLITPSLLSFLIAFYLLSSPP